MAELRLSPNLVRRLETSERVLARCEQIGAKGQAYAEAISPVRTGRYRASFRVVRTTRGGRTIVRLINTARDPRSGYPYPYALEYGTRYMKRQRILGRTAGHIRRG